MTYTAVGAYIYAGGFTLGAQRAGFDVPAHFEEGNFGTKTARDNLGVETHESPETWPIRQYRDRVSFVHSNPPCAPWSNAGAVIDGRRGAAYAGDARLACVERSFEAFLALGADVWAWESVARTPQLAKAYIEDLARRAAKHGHETTVVTLDAVHTGAPQYRRRAFIICHNVQLDLTLPQQYLQRPRTVRDAWRDERPAPMPRPNTSPLTAPWLHKVPQGAKLNKEYDRLNGTKDERHVKGRPGFLQRRLAWDRPAFTITGGAHHYHPTEHRYVSVPESAVLCGYPADYAFAGGVSSQYAQVGKGVTVQAAEWLARAVKNGLGKKKSVAAPGAVRCVDLTRGAAVAT